MIIAAVMMLVLFLSVVVFPQTFSFFSLGDQSDPVKPSQVISHWTETDAANELAKYLEGGESAFWLNPNRYRPDGGYDLLAEPYREQPRLGSAEQSALPSYDPDIGDEPIYTYGTWQYVGSTNTKSIFRM